MKSKMMEQKIAPFRRGDRGRAARWAQARSSGRSDWPRPEIKPGELNLGQGQKTVGHQVLAGPDRCKKILGWHTCFQTQLPRFDSQHSPQKF